MMLWFWIGFPAVYLGIGTTIAAVVNQVGPPISPRSWFYLMRAWPFILFYDVMNQGIPRSKNPPPVYPPDF